jgi:hypothetical protein
LVDNFLRKAEMNTMIVGDGEFDRRSARVIVRETKDKKPLPGGRDACPDSRIQPKRELAEIFLFQLPVTH